MSEFAEEKRKERERERAQRVVDPRRRRVIQAVGVALCVATWVVPVPRPGDDVGVPTAERRATSARLTLLLASRRVESFRQQYHRLPTTLLDAGVSEPSMMYSTAGDTFELRLSVDSSQLTFRSGDAAPVAPGSDSAQTRGIVP
ncbi:MAG: hypothetical protein IT361_12715 [Gemmatimonadaceae bacterium]|nr:hypothetical protein [Gemmatimonadaceae bacterium]